MCRSRRAGRATVVAAVLLPLLALGPSAGAAVQPSELALAVAETNVAIGDAAVEVALINTKNPNVTCGFPTVHGATVTPGRDLYVATVHGVDAGAGQGDCVSRTVMTYTGTLVLTVEYRTLAGSWEPIPGCKGSGTMTSVNGVLVVPATVLCRYEGDDPASGRPHRISAVFMNSLSSDEYPGYSEPWQS